MSVWRTAIFILGGWPVRERVRVVEFGCGDGRFTLLLNWVQEETARYFAADARSVLAGGG